MLLKYEVSSEDLERLNERISQLGDEAEQTVNDVIHNEGAELTKQDFTRYLPVSERAKTHAKFSEPWKVTNLNLGIEITTKGGSANARGSFGYLIFPDEAIGRRNPIRQDFTGKGVRDARPKIVKLIQEKVIENIEGGK